ncbi:hypothetical protein E8F11_18745 [Pseudomonas sp. BN417]|nr:hypothetical protein [Pseudomonas sp. BN417]
MSLRCSLRGQILTLLGGSLLLLLLITLGCFHFLSSGISRNLAEITAIASTNEQNVQRTHGTSQHLHGLSGDLKQLTARLHA